MNDTVRFVIASALLDCAGVAIGYGFTFFVTPAEYPQSDVTATAPAVIAQRPSVVELPDFLSMTEGELVASCMGLDAFQLRRAIRSLSSEDLTDSHCQVALRIALEVMAERDPNKFLGWIGTADVPEGLSTPAIEIAAALLAKGDPHDGMSALKGLSSRAVKRTAIVAYASALSKQEPELAIQFLVSSGLVESSVISSIADSAPEMVANLFANIRQVSMMVPRAGINIVMAQWARHDPEAAWVWLNTTDNYSVAQHGKTELIAKLAANPDTARMALGYLRELPNEWDRQVLGGEIAVEFATHPDLDPAILKSILDTADPSERVAMLSGISRLLMPEEVVTAVESLPGQTQRNKAISDAMSATRDQEAALQIAKSLGNPADRITARHQLLNHYRSEQVEAVQVAFAAEFPREREHLLDTVAGWLLPLSRFRPDDPAWITSLPPEQRHELESAITRDASEKAIPIPDNVSSALSGE